MRLIDCDQRTAAWFAVKAGKPSASHIAEVLAVLKRKEGEAAARRNYKARIVAEILTGRCQDQFVSPYMMDGNDYEPFAKAAYEVRYDVEIENVGFVLHPTIDRSGCSPDGLVGTDGLVEFKCPATVTHLDYLLRDEVPADYQPQMLWQMACCERQWDDFVSYDPRLPEHLQLFVKRFPRDDKRIVVMEAAVLQFLAEVDEILSRLPRADGTRPDLVPSLTQSLTQGRTL